MGMGAVEVSSLRQRIPRLHPLPGKGAHGEDMRGRFVERTVAGSPLPGHVVEDTVVRLVDEYDRSRSMARKTAHGPRIRPPQRQIGRHQQRIHAGGACPVDRPGPGERIGGERARSGESVPLQGWRVGARAQERRPVDAGRRRVAVPDRRADMDLMAGFPQDDGHQVEELGIGVEGVDPEYLHSAPPLPVRHRARGGGMPSVSMPSFPVADAAAQESCGPTWRAWPIRPSWRR